MFVFARNMETDAQFLSSEKTGILLNYRFCTQKEIIKGWKHLRVYGDYPHRDGDGDIFLYFSDLSQYLVMMNNHEHSIKSF